MATTYITVDTGGTGDYNSLANWVAGEAGTLTDPMEVDCQCSDGTADNGVTISGFTTSAVNNIKIWCNPASGYRHAGVWNDAKYRIDANAAHAMIVNNSNIIIDGLQVTNHGTNYDNNCFYQTTAIDNVLFDSCIAKYTGSSTNQRGFAISNAGNTNIEFRNCLAYDFTATVGYGFYLGSSDGSNYVKNCTAVNCAYGLYSLFHKASATNCIGEDCTTEGIGIYFTTTTTCLDNAGVTFLDPGNDNYQLDSSDTIAIDQGTNLSSEGWDNDIAGTTRDSSWDIGAFEYTAGATPASQYVYVPMDIFRIHAM